MYLHNCTRRPPQVDDIQAEFFLVSQNHAISGHSDAAIFGHACAANAVTVAAIEWVEGDGLGGAFEGRFVPRGTGQTSRAVPRRLLPGALLCALDYVKSSMFSFANITHLFMPSVAM